MKRNSPNKKANLLYTLVLIVYSLLGVFLLRYYQYQIDPDGVSYISIAQKYLRGDFGNAISGYWGPLFSWLLIPFLSLGLTPLFAVKLLSLIIGLLTIIGVRGLSYKFNIAEEIRVVILLAMVPIVLYFSLTMTTPDLLLACILIFYLAVIFEPSYPDRRRNGVLCGALGAVAYLCKSYGFPFFISHFLLCNAFHYLGTTTEAKKKEVLRNLSWGLIVFFALSGVWVYLISSKYGEITFSKAGAYSWRLVGPDYFPWGASNVMRFQGFLKPPNETAVSAFEDPSYLVGLLRSWSPIESWESFKFELKFVAKNILGFIETYVSFSPFSVTIIVGYILFCAVPFSKIFQSRELYPLATVILYSAGLTQFPINERFLWFVYILLILMGGHILNALLNHSFFNGTRKRIALMFFALSFVIFPIRSLRGYKDTGKDIYNLSQTLKREYGIHGNIASNVCWLNTLHLVFHLNSKYYGIPRRNVTGIDLTDLEDELKRNDIDYYFVWNNDTDYHFVRYKEKISTAPEAIYPFRRERHDGSQFLSNYREETSGKIPGLRIYNLKVKGDR
ncbi:MAG TPA: ArnT family glycosyltransferase [Candidatus Hypogeohydataceae bacterium YC38]